MRLEGHFTLPHVEQLFLDALDGAVDLVGADRALAQRQVERGQQLARSYSMRRPSFLTDGREVDVGPLVGGEALFAGAALAPAADEIPLLRHPGFDDLGLLVAAERALHGALAAINRLSGRPGSGWSTR
jgi:hypothetical protein